MGSKLEYKRIKIGSQYIEYASLGNKEPLFFLHGFTSPPEFQTPFLEGLAKEYEVIAPKLYGVHYLKKQPRLIEDYVDVTREFIHKIGAKEYHLAGHSTGGAVAYRIATESRDALDVIGIDPVLPSPSTLRLVTGVAHDLEERIVSAATSLNKPEMRRRMLNDLGFGKFIFMNCLSAPVKSATLIKDIADFDFQNVDVKVPALILYGKKDRFFNLEYPDIMRLEKSFDELYVLKKAERDHIWIIDNPDEVADEVKRFINPVRRLERIAGGKYSIHLKEDVKKR